MNFENLIWWCQFACNEEWIPDSITKFGWDLKIRSINDKESPIQYVCSLIICCSPNWEVTPSILEPAYGVMWLLYQRLDFALKSPKMTATKALFIITESRFNSRLLINDSQLSWHWFVEQYNEIKLQSLTLIFILKLMHSCK